MATLKVIEVLAESDKGSLHGIKSVWLKNLNAIVVDGKISSWRLDCKISFQLDGEE